MRLIPLKEHNERLDQFLAMWSSYIAEKHPDSNDIKKESFQSVRGDLFLFEYDQMPIGFAKIDLRQECFPDEDMPELMLHILAFYIMPESRRQHLGQEAFKLLRQWGRDNKAALVEVEADSEEACLFLKEQGLELVGKGVHKLFRGFI